MDYRVQRGITRDQVATLMQREWLDRRHNVILEGATGTGKTFLCHAIARHWCEQGLRVRYLMRLKRLFAQLTIAHADGTYNKLLKQLAGMDLLIIDDWGVEVLTDIQTRLCSRFMRARVHDLMRNTVHDLCEYTAALEPFHFILHGECRIHGYQPEAPLAEHYKSQAVIA
jgi:MoxR-like ATPase